MHTLTILWWSFRSGLSVAIASYTVLKSIPKDNWTNFKQLRLEHVIQNPDHIEPPTGLLPPPSTEQGKAGE